MSDLIERICPLSECICEHSCEYCCNECKNILSGYLEEHNSKVREDAIEEFAKWLKEKDYLNKTEIDYDWDEHSYLDIVSMTKEEILEEYMDWLTTEKN